MTAVAGPGTFDRETSVSKRRRAWPVIAASPGVAALVLAMIGPWIAPHRLGRTVGVPLSAAGDGHVLGTDHLGRDVWSQVLHGGRSIVIIPIIATVVTCLTASLLGVAAAYTGGQIDRLASRIVDVTIAVPAILVLLVLVNGWGSSPWVLVLAVLVTNGPYAMRYVRATAMQVVSAGYVEQAIALGERPAGVIGREVLPNVAGPLVADASLRLVSAIYLVASASFLGFGPPRPATDWARMINENLSGAGLNPWAVVAPALAIVALTTSVMVLADQAGRRWAR